MSGKNATVHIYSDGSCHNGMGGWAYIILDRQFGEIIKRDYGAVDDTTNNRMELMAAINAIRNTPVGSSLHIYTDSSYLKDGFHHPSYLSKWMKNGWKTSKRKPVENQDLWQEILQLSLMYKLRFTLVKGHNRDKEDPHKKYNDIVDSLCHYEFVRSQSDTK